MYGQSTVFDEILAWSRVDDLRREIESRQRMAEALRRQKDRAHSAGGRSRHNNLATVWRVVLGLR
jgi:hypothetical protein